MAVFDHGEATAAPASEPMKRLLLITDPLGGSQSVQLELLLSLGKGLQREYRISVFTPHCDPEMAELIRGADLELLVPSRRDFAINRGLRLFDYRNEAMLWAESWVRETLFGANHSDARRVLEGRSFDRVVNLASTVVYPSDLWWIQGTPLDLTVAGMARTNWAAGLADATARRLIRSRDDRVAHRIASVSKQVVASSPYVMKLYRGRQVPVSGVIYSVKDLEPFQPSSPSPTRDFVLTYVGKEAEPLDFHQLKESGVRVVGFGGKVPAGTRMGDVTGCIDFRGFVPHGELVDLYSNAMFTLFPFSYEALGYVPLESMACGTPVLTFDRQGPGETVVDGQTGWLVRSRDEMVRKAQELWNRGITGISAEACVRRASAFSFRRSVSDVLSRIERGPQPG